MLVKDQIKVEDKVIPRVFYPNSICDEVISTQLLCDSSVHTVDNMLYETQFMAIQADTTWPACRAEKISPVPISTRYLSRAWTESFTMYLMRARFYLLAVHHGCHQNPQGVT